MVFIKCNYIFINRDHPGFIKDKQLTDSIQKVLEQSTPVAHKINPWQFNLKKERRVLISSKGTVLTLWGTDP